MFNLEEFVTVGFLLCLFVLEEPPSLHTHQSRRIIEQSASVCRAGLWDLAIQGFSVNVMYAYRTGTSKIKVKIVESLFFEY